jgi:hypothetical protein
MVEVSIGNITVDQADIRTVENRASIGFAERIGAGLQGRGDTPVSPIETSGAPAF